MKYIFKDSYRVFVGEFPEGIVEEHQQKFCGGIVATISVGIHPRIPDGFPIGILGGIPIIIINVGITEGKSSRRNPLNLGRNA